METLLLIYKMIYSHSICKSFTSLLFGFFFSKRLPKNVMDYNIKGMWDRKGVIENEKI
jgi:hypothetical protein